MLFAVISVKDGIVVRMLKSGAGRIIERICKELKH